MKKEKVTDVSRKKGGCIRRMLYRWLAWVLLGLCVSLLASDFEMTKTLVNDPRGVFLGEVTSVPAYRNAVAGLSVRAMAAAVQPSEENQTGLLNELSARDGLLCYVASEELGAGAWPDAPSAPLLSEETGQLTLPAGYSLLFARLDGEEWITFLGERMLLADFETQARMRCPSVQDLGDVCIVLASRDGAGSPWHDHMYTATRWQYLSWAAAGTLLLSLLLFLYTAIRAKDVRAGKALVAGALGRVWLEIKLAVALVLLLDLWQTLRYGNGYWKLLGISSPWAGLILIFLGYYLLWADLSINGMDLYECSGCAALGRAARGWIKKQPWQQRVLGGFGAGMLAAVALAGLTGLMVPLFFGRDGVQALIWAVIFAVCSVAALYGAFWILRRLVAEWGLVADKLADVRAGRPSAPLALPEDSLLAGPAGDLNRIEEGVALAVEQRSRADRMKVELITNVSHDIKTPLTSILSYADLLCAEPDLPVTAAGYACILQQKATQLRGMVQDVFELSKAASGDLPVELTELDLAKLIRQTLADMDERIAAAPAQFKVQLCPEAWVLADGDRLYRVFQNLFANAAQYSMPGSRVYVTLTAADGQARASVKNIADYELGTLGMEVQELTERFVRGDASRSSEGSGLGLSIAKSFTEACGGELTVRTDADLFVVAVTLPLAARQGGMPQEIVPGELPAEGAKGAAAVIALPDTAARNERTDTAAGREAADMTSGGAGMPAVAGDAPEGTGTAANAESGPDDVGAAGAAKAVSGEETVVSSMTDNAAADPSDPLAGMEEIPLFEGV